MLRNLGAPIHCVWGTDRTYNHMSIGAIRIRPSNILRIRARMGNCGVLL